MEPSKAELATKLSLQTRARMSYRDVTIVGGEPTGLTTALYVAREGLDVLVIEKSALGSVVHRRSIISVRSHHLMLDQVASSQLPLVLDHIAQVNRRHGRNRVTM